MAERIDLRIIPARAGFTDRTNCLDRDFRIIPARAGFTGVWSDDSVGVGDHPRSRGVYYKSLHKRFSRTGSSPLARGLPRPEMATAQQFRIIPARAGFTTNGHHLRGGARDHPRSRGVYMLAWLRVVPLNGSSPLARGLLTLPATIRHYGGIIPARAGFTTYALSKSAIPTDHPRSRGVYPTAALKRLQDAGSSPLARGLPGQLR